MSNYIDKYLKYKKKYQALKKKTLEEYIDCHKLYVKKLTDKEKKEKKDYVYNYILKNVIKDKNFDKLTPKQLEQVYLILDKTYFNGKINEYINDNRDIKLNFKISGKLTSTAGVAKYRYKKKEDKRIKFKYVIEISSPIVYSLFSKGEKFLKINGLVCKDKLECFINLFEHELTHLLVQLFCPELGVGMGGHTKIYRDIVYNLFGHTEYKHLLLYGDIVETEKKAEEVKTNVEIGDYVISKPYGKNKQVIAGTVIKVNPKGVTIALENGKLINIYYLSIEKVEKKKGDSKILKKLGDVKEDIKKFKDKLKVGDTVYVRIKQQIQKGEILAINPTKAKVKMEDEKIWYVPYNMIML